MDEARANARIRYDDYCEWLAARADLKKMHKVWQSSSPEAKSQFARFIEFQTGSPINTSVLWHDLVGLWSGHDKHMKLAEVARPLVEWWVSQGRPITKTVYSNPKKSDHAPDDGASDVVKWLAGEMGAITGKRMMPSTARTLLDHLS